MLIKLRLFFFFSSRRRHTRSLRDWSSDVCSSDLGAGALEELVTAYYGRPRRSKTARAWLLGGLVGMYGWTLWGAIQNGASPIDYDFWSWAMERFEGAARGFTAASFEDLLEDVQRDD